MTSQLPRFRYLFLSYQLQKTPLNRVAVASLRPFLFCDDFRIFQLSLQPIQIRITTGESLHSISYNKGITNWI